MKHCPRCGHDLPAPYAPARAAAYVAGALQASYQIAVGSPWRSALFATLESAVIIGLTVAWAIFLWRNFWIHDEPDAPEEPDERPLRHESRMVGGGLRVTRRTQNHVRWLREQGFVVPAEPERGALSRWLYAVRDGVNTFSQRGARTALRDTPKVREWATQVLALWCTVGWCEPANGWNGDAPDLGNGVTEVDEEMIYECASGGQARMIELLMAVAERDLEAPYTERE